MEIFANSQIGFSDCSESLRNVLSMKIVHFHTVISAFYGESLIFLGLTFINELIQFLFHCLYSFYSNLCVFIYYCWCSKIVIMCVAYIILIINNSNELKYSHFLKQNLLLWISLVLILSRPQNCLLQTKASSYLKFSASSRDPWP